MSETDFGAEKVRSKPGTEPSPGTPWLPSSGSPSTGLRPVSIAVSWSAPDLARELQLAGGVAHPLPGDLALAGVVVLRAFGDLLQVVGLLADAELADGQHALSVRREGVLPHQSPEVITREGVVVGCWGWSERRSEASF